MSYTLGECIEDAKYRYLLRATTACKTGRQLVLIQCNPSVASSHRSDSTVGKVSLWAAANDFERITFLNLFAWRSPRIDQMAGMAFADLVGPDNDRVIQQSVSSTATIVLAWGGDLPVTSKLYKQRLLEVRTLLDDRRIHRVGALSYGRYPRHGRMWNKNNRTLCETSWAELQIS